MKSYKLLHFAFVGLLFIAAACGTPTETSQETISESNNLVAVTTDQFKADSMVIGALSPQVFNEEIRCNGYITTAAGGMAQISSPVVGIVESITCSMGGYVTKGQSVCTISGAELMAMQQEFTETAARLTRLKSEYDRSKALYTEKIGAEKEFIATESEYKAAKAKYLSLKLRLELLHLNINQIESGNLYSTFTVVSPINGYITKQNLVLGQFIEQQKLLVEIVDISRLQVQLSVFEKDISLVKPGQTVLFSPPGVGTLSSEASIVSVGKAVNSETRSVTCVASIKNNLHANLINQSFVEASIVVNSNKSNALPSEALIKSGKDYYVLVVEKSDKAGYYFRKQKVETGRISNGFTEIKGNLILTNVLVKGVYHLSAN